MSKDKETLVILIPGFPKDEADSTCLPSQQNFVRCVKELYPHLNIIVLSFQYAYHTKKYKWFDIEVIPFSGKNKGGFSKLLLRQKVFSVLTRLNKENKITGLLSFWYNECALVGHRFGKRNNIKHYCWIRGQDARVGNKYIKYVKPDPAELIALSDFLQEEFEKNYTIRPIHVIPPGINTNRFPLPVKKDIDILAAGSLIPLKQFDVLVEVIARIKEKIPDIKALLIGEGPEREKLQELIITHGLQNNIVLTGELSHIEVLKRMQKAKLLLHTSSYEGFSGVCLEALHAGCHVISFCKAMNHLIDQWHIVTTKEEMIYRSIETLQNPATEYKAVTPYPMEQSVKKIMQLFSF
jgi:glycosyltransferase involved in cell wall biosynthesis